MSAITSPFQITLDQESIKKLYEQLEVSKAIKSNEGGFYYPTVPGPSGEVTEREQRVSRYLHFKRTDAEGRTSTIEVPVLTDGTIHVDPAAFAELMAEIGFVGNAS